jgi:ABC-type multidrug transport system permease subunit
VYQIGVAIWASLHPEPMSISASMMIVAYGLFMVCEYYCGELQRNPERLQRVISRRFLVYHLEGCFWTLTSHSTGDYQIAAF